jgi:hypothetical protein
MKFKKLILGLGLSFSLLGAAQLNIDVTNAFVNNNNAWQITMTNGNTFYFMSPIDIDFSQFQSILGDNQTVWLYRWYQRRDLVKADFGINVLGLVKITNSNIVYYINDNGTWRSYNDFDSFKNKMYQLAENISDPDKKAIFENSYVAGFEKLFKSKLYLIQPSGGDLNINFDLSTFLNNMQSENASPTNINSTTNNEEENNTTTVVNEENVSNENNISTIETPPMPPQINDTNDNQSDNSVIQTPPMPPK